MSVARSVALLAGLALLGATGCGGLVVFVDDDGAGGSSAGGAGPGPGSNTSSNNGSSNSLNNSSNNGSSSTGTPADLCDQYCSVWGNCAGPSCELYCNEYTSGECAAEATAYFTCMAASTNAGCPSKDDVCQEQYLAFVNCFGPLPNCFGQGCEFDDDFCSCVGICGGSTLQQFCQGNSCDCYLDDNYIGSCQTAAECSVEEGCCQLLTGSFN